MSVAEVIRPDLVAEYRIEIRFDATRAKDAIEFHRAVTRLGRDKSTVTIVFNQMLGDPEGESFLSVARADAQKSRQRIHGGQYAEPIGPAEEIDPAGYIELDEQWNCSHGIHKGLGCRVCDPAS